MEKVRSSLSGGLLSQILNIIGICIIAALFLACLLFENYEVSALTGR